VVCSGWVSVRHLFLARDYSYYSWRQINKDQMAFAMGIFYLLPQGVCISSVWTGSSLNGMRQVALQGCLTY
jgi:hypothetical protein